QAGLCAVHEMIKLIGAVESLPMPVHPLVGTGQITLTDILSDPYPGHSVIPNRCRVTYDRRLVPGETPESVLASLKNLPGLEAVQYTAAIPESEDQTGTGQVLRGAKFFPAWALDENHPFVQSALRGLRAAGIEPRTGAYQFCTNAAYSAGSARVPTVGFGPGRETDAHTVDERIALDDLARAMQGYLGILQAVLYR
ncbi:MAG TPA: M20/M25/M40 family metallo-hydrolase, partial [Anaerolineaceae bacterium]